MLHLLSMTTGEPHPAAKDPIIACPGMSQPANGSGVQSISITDSKLAILVDPDRGSLGMGMVVWDWRTGDTLLVSDSLASSAPDPSVIHVFCIGSGRLGLPATRFRG